LTPRQVSEGFEVQEDDHVITLKRKDELIAAWPITHDHPTQIEIQDAADRAREEDLITFERAK